MEVPAVFIFFALVFLVAMSVALGWVLARSFQPLAPATNITCFSGPGADPTLTPLQQFGLAPPHPKPGDSEPACPGPASTERKDEPASSTEGPPDELSPALGDYWINPGTFTLHRCVEICGPTRHLSCGSKQPRGLEQVYLCEFCWPTDKRKSR